MADLAGYSFNYDAGAQRPTRLVGWQVCLGHPETQSLEDADNYPDYLVHRQEITQMLGMGMTRGQNAYTRDGMLFVVLLAEQAEGSPAPRPLAQDDPAQAAAAPLVAEQLLQGADHGMLAFFPNGHIVPFAPTAGPAE